MKYRGKYLKPATSLMLVLSCVALSSFAADSIDKARNIADQELFFGPVPKADQEVPSHLAM